MNLHFRTVGEGKPLIIVHGLYGSSDNWLSIAGKLDGYKCYLIDQRNHGQSPKTHSHTYSDLVEDLKQFIQQHNIQKPLLIGHSMGGKTVMQFTLQYPELVNKMVVVDIAPKDYNGFKNFGKVTTDHREIIDTLLDVDISGFATRKAINEHFEGLFSDARVRMFLLKNLKRDKELGFIWRVNLSTLSTHLDDIMGGIPIELGSNDKVETLFIRGADSPYIDEDDLFQIRNFFPLANLVSIPNAGHWLHVDQPDLLIGTLNYFLE